MFRDNVDPLWHRLVVPVFPVESHDIWNCQRGVRVCSLEGAFKAKKVTEGAALKGCTGLRVVLTCM